MIRQKDAPPSRRSLLRALITQGVLKTPRIIEAFFAVDRKNFVPEAFVGEAYADAPLPIGEGQTISQPRTVAFMLELLQPQPGERMLDIGAGSGWVSALLAHIASRPDVEVSPGKVFAVERLPKICTFGRRNIAKYNYLERGIVEWHCRDGTKGLPEHAPFDRIIAAAAGAALPEAWLEQLAIGGRIVAPIRDAVWLFERRGANDWYKKKYPGFSFVPLVKE
ncbi:MAG: protein-L-isoaspartate O-methyltransferase [bacterium]|nr:protein-L-isoaspartate O-methyltransferase [bacterium]MDZ4296074.1 protein-L-isoaspartate O-methyltransferase [Patescibacteria group bacterium]